MKVQAIKSKNKTVHFNIALLFKIFYSQYQVKDIKN